MPPGKLPNFPPTPIKVATVADFTGGLNTRANAFQLGQNETPDSLDVTLDIGGGFVQRQVVQPFGAVLPGGAAALNLFSLSTASTAQVVVMASDKNLYWSTGGAWTSITGTPPFASKCHGAVFNNVLYLQDGQFSAIAWDGTTKRVLGQAWNETIGGEGVADGNMPVAKYLTAHMGRLFAAGTLEGGISYPNRIRWSHPSFPEDWRQEDFIDIDVGRDGDVITGIIEFRERIYIFKNFSISVLTGYGPTNFAVTPLAQDMGAVSQDSVCLTDVGLAFFSWPQGVYLDKGSGPYPIFDKIWPTIRDGHIPPAYKKGIALGYVNRNFWAAVPWEASSVNARTLVYNPWIWRHRYMRFLEGPWYAYSTAIGAFCTFRNPASGTTLWLAAHATKPYIGILEQNGSQDNWGDGATNIQSYYTTNWFDMGQEAVFKRWRHPDLVMRAGAVAQIRVDVKKDYDPSTIYKTYYVGETTPLVGMLWDIGAPAPAVVTAGAAGTTSYSYRVTALVGTSEGEASTEVTIATGNATLDGTNYNVVSWTALTGATSYNVYGRTLGAEKLITNVTGTTYNDQGAALGTQSPPLTSAVGGKWDDGTGTTGGPWEGIPQQAEAIVRGKSMGSARSIQLIFTGPSGQFWGLDALSLKFIPKRLRG